MRPTLSDALGPPAPTVDIAPSTCGFSLTMVATCRCMSAIASNDTSCAASVNTRIRPESSAGRKPLGIQANSTPVATVMTKKTAIVKRWCKSARVSVAR